MKKLLTILLVSFSILAMNVSPVFAATGTTSASLASTSVAVGNKVKLTLKLKCSGGVGGGVIHIMVDENYISKVDMSTNNYATFASETNRILINGSETASLTLTVTLTTKKIGKTKIDINISGFIDFDSGDLCTDYKEDFSLTLNITKPVTPTKTLSQDATIAKLSTGDLLLEQAFDPSVLEYTLYAPKGTENLEISATPSSAKAKMEAIDTKVVEGWNKVNIVCIAENGSKQTYVINVYVEQTPTIFFNETLGIVKNLDKVIPIEGFELIDYDYQGNTIQIYNHENLNLIYLVDQNEVKNFYVFDIKENIVKAIYQPILIDGKSYLRTEFNYEDFEELEDDFIQAEVKVAGEMLPGWKYIAENMEDYALVYLKDENGNDFLFSYDSYTNTLQRYTLPIKSYEKLQMNILYSFAAAGVCIFLFAIIYVVKNRKD